MRASGSLPCNINTEDELCSERYVYVEGVMFKLCAAALRGQNDWFNLSVLRENLRPGETHGQKSNQECADVIPERHSAQNPLEEYHARQRCGVPSDTFLRGTF